MANYLVNKFKGIYRILPEIDPSTNDFPRDENDNYDEDMVYISCQYGNKIYYWGLNESRRGVLYAYVPSLGRGRNIKKAMKKQKIDFFDYDESAEEVTFKFLASDIDSVAELLKARTSGANTSPFSSKNLPKSDVSMPTEEIERYRAITSKLNKTDMLVIKNVNQAFMDNILAQKLKAKNAKTPFDYKTDMKQMKMSRQIKEYIFTKGLWKDYLEYLAKEIESHYA